MKIHWREPGIRLIPASIAIVFLIGLEWALWVALVPATLSMPGLLWLHVLILVMFATGVGTAAKGLPSRSVAGLLYDVENPTRSVSRR
jgi:hypothetical protein